MKGVRRKPEEGRGHCCLAPPPEQEHPIGEESEVNNNMSKNYLFNNY